MQKLVYHQKLRSDHHLHKTCKPEILFLKLESTLFTLSTYKHVLELSVVKPGYQQKSKIRSVSMTFRLLR